MIALLLLFAFYCFLLVFVEFFGLDVFDLWDICLLMFWHRTFQLMNTRCWKHRLILLVIKFLYAEILVGLFIIKQLYYLIKMMWTGFLSPILYVVLLSKIMKLFRQFKRYLKEQWSSIVDILDELEVLIYNFLMQVWWNMEEYLPEPWMDLLEYLLEVLTELLYFIWQLVTFLPFFLIYQILLFYNLFVDFCGRKRPREDEACFVVDDEIQVFTSRGEIRFGMEEAKDLSRTRRMYWLFYW
ncbi:hypothetical protein JTE90_022746 [Oedothorax gibbosus]|uniref:Transmembrane protein n=1 Tax=Oedothorax gibbosus TaxID=931172 RepID=A0AAV6URD0_9ARAC|nr:hypothetical protein JTE90_022746 [Oedothorax gibbosus]